MGRNSTRPDSSIIRAAIEATGSLEDAATSLNVHRTTLWRWLRELEKEGQAIPLERRTTVAV